MGIGGLPYHGQHVATYHEIYKQLAQAALAPDVVGLVMRRARAASGGHAKAKALREGGKQIALAAARAGVNPPSPLPKRAAALVSKKKKVVRIQKAARARVQQGAAPIIDRDAKKQVVFCIAMEPDATDLDGEYVTADDIEDAAHHYMRHFRDIKVEHSGKPVLATPVESFIARHALDFDGGMYGPQHVPQGSWVLGIQVHDSALWKAIVSGAYTGISVGGAGVRDDDTDSLEP